MDSRLIGIALGAAVVIAFAFPPGESGSVVAQTAGDLTGVYVGSYICNGQQVPLWLTLEQTSATDVAGTFAFFLPRGGVTPAQPTGTYEVSGTVDPGSGSVRLDPGPWVGRVMGNLTRFGLSGTADAARGYIRGNLDGRRGCTTFEVTREAGRTADLREQRAEAAQAVAPAPIELADSNEITGAYLGSYICDRRQMSLLLILEQTAVTELSGVFALFPPGGDPQQPTGVYELHGTLDAASGAIRLAPGNWLGGAFQAGRRAVGLSGTYDTSSRRISGRIEDASCSTFEVALDAPRTAELRQQLAASARAVAEAPDAFAAARTQQEQCIVISKWLSRFLREYPDRSRMTDVPSAMINLFDDTDFVQVFGKPLERMSRAERDPVSRAIGMCRNDAAYRQELATIPLHAPFQDGAGRTSFGDATAAVAYRRTLRAELQQTLGAAGAVPASAGGLDRALALRDARNPDFEILWPSEIRQLDEALEFAVMRAAAPALDAWVASLEAGRGEEGLAAILQGLASGDAGAPGRPPLLSLVDDETRVRAETRLRSAASRMVGELVAEHRAELGAMGSGLQALEAGSRWYATFTASFRAVSEDPAVGAALRALADRRREDLVIASADLLRRIQAASSASEVGSIVNTYLAVPSDRTDMHGAQLLAAADSRSGALATAAEQAAIEARSSANFCKGISDAGEQPSSQALCLAVAARFDAINDELRATKSACEGGGAAGNPLLALQCVQLCMGTGGTCDVQFQLTGFERLACVEAHDAPGVVCDYAFAFTASNAVVRQAIEAVMGPAGTAQGRFIQDGSNWMQVRR